MDASIIGPTDELPEGAELMLTAANVMRGKGTFLIGRIECAEVRLQDRVVAVTEKSICRGVVVAIERWMQSLAVARRGDEVALMMRGWADFPVVPGTRLYLVPRTT
jgi:translation elongation factor EF-Tu-like GTPase